MIVACGVDFGKVDDLALNFFKAMELAAWIAADGRFAALDDLRFGEMREASSLFGFGFGLG